MEILNFSQLSEEIIAGQWYAPTGEFKPSTSELKLGLTAQLREATGEYGSAIYVDVDLAGKRLFKAKVGSIIADKIRTAHPDITSTKVDVDTMIVTKLSKTANAVDPKDGKLAATIYRASFDWE